MDNHFSPSLNHMNSTSRTLVLVVIIQERYEKYEIQIFGQVFNKLFPSCNFLVTNYLLKGVDECESKITENWKRVKSSIAFRNY